MGTTKKYAGSKDEHNHRQNTGEQSWINEKTYQKYTGQFVYNNLHGSGFYFIENENKNRYFYDGTFYTNELNGYCTVYYMNGDTFYGLFKCNVRFGPGIYTYHKDDGIAADLGFWNEHKLRRLACTVDNTIPKLGKTLEGKTNMLRFRRIVPARPSNEDIAREILQHLHANKTVLNKSSTLYNSDIQDINSLFFNRQMYDKAFQINILYDKNARKAQLDKINERLCQIRCLKDYFMTCGQCYCLPGEQDKKRPSINHNDNAEDEILCPICLCDDNSMFESPPTKLASLDKEQQFFISLQAGLMKPQHYPAHKSINVDELLAWNNEPDIIDILQHCFMHRKRDNFKLEAFLRGQREEFPVSGEYESACKEFLESCQIGDVKKAEKLLVKHDLNPDLSDSNGNGAVISAANGNHVQVLEILVNYGAKLDLVNDEGLSALNLSLLNYLAVLCEIKDWEAAFLDVSEAILQDIQNWLPFSNTNFENQRLSCNTKYLFTLDPKQTANQEDPKLVDIQNTIKALLCFGVDPNAVSVPLNSLILSLFTENPKLVEILLENGAKANILHKNHLTCLHIICSLKISPENIEICRLLLKFNCNPNVKTKHSYLCEQTKKIAGFGCDLSCYDDLGRNPLHILCIRTDFNETNAHLFAEMAKTLILHQTNSSDLFIGHTALSLAVLHGNLWIIKALIQLDTVNQYELLNHNMGNILTVHLLKRYANFLRPNVVEQVLKCLVIDLEVDPFEPIGIFDNVIEFLEGEHKKPVEKNGKKKAKSKKKTKSKKRNSQQALIEYLKDLCRQFLINKLQIRIVRILYDFHEANMLGDEISKILATFLTRQTTFNHLKTVFQSGLVNFERFNLDSCIDLINFVKEYEVKEKPKRQKSKKRSKSAEKKSGKKPTEPEVNYVQLLESTTFVPQQTKTALYDIKKHRVCFHCLKKRDKNLIKCPKCELIYFCSEQCNKLNMKLQTGHHCKSLFYNKNAKGEEIQTTRLDAIASLAYKWCEERLYLERQQKLRLLEAELIEQKKLDIYGTRFLRKSKKNLDYSDILRATCLSATCQRLPSFETHLDEPELLTTFLKEKENSPKQPLIRREKCKCKQESKKKEETKNVVGELIERHKFVPNKQQFFLSLLNKHFPETDFTSLFLPFVCFHEGQLYYKFKSSFIRNHSYSNT